MTRYLGNALVLVPRAVYLFNNPSGWMRYAQKVGPVNSIIYHFLSTLPVAFLVGLFFGIIGLACGERWQEAANQRSAERIAAARQAQQAGKVWPPPIKEDRDDT